MNLRTISSTFFSAALGLGLSLTGCSGDDSIGASESSDSNGTDTTGDSTGDPTGDPTGDTTGDPTGDPTGDTTGSTTDPTTDSTTASTTDPTAPDACDACSDDATCNPDGTCECKDGFEGDGQSCADLDECDSGKNTCDPDATCINEPGDYKCECNEGYKGNGMSCKDLDECNEGTDECSNNAECTNNDGGYNCECKDGFTGDGFTCNGSKEFGEVCEDPEACESGLCLTDVQCTVDCSIASAANDCRDQGYYGLCIYIGDEDHPFICSGEISAGSDKDDTIVNPGDQITRPFQSVNDLDIHLVKAPAGSYAIYATPEEDDDLAVVFYNIDGSLLAEQDAGGKGVIEGANVDSGGDPIYAVVVNVGTSNGTYKFNVDKL